MKCEKCGKEMSLVSVGVFNYDGSDSDHLTLIQHEESEEEGAVVIETTQNWTGYELSEEEMMETIRCPHCNEFPFIHREVQVYDVVRIVCFKTYHPTEKGGEG